VNTTSLVVRCWWLFGYLLVATVVWLSLAPGVPGPDLYGIDKLEHCFAYLMLMLWFAQVTERRHWLGTALTLALLGLLLEIGQLLVPERFFSVWDLGANWLGVVFGWLLASAGLNRGVAVAAGALKLVTAKK
jgi:VanZ family protein